MTVASEEKEFARDASIHRANCPGCPVCNPDGRKFQSTVDLSVRLRPKDVPAELDALRRALAAKNKLISSDE